MTTITQESNDSLQNELQLNRSNVGKMSNFIKLSDNDTDNQLDLFSYIKCTNDDTEFLKSCRGVVFNEENVVLHGFPYTEEYTVGGENNDMLVTKFENLSEYKVFTAHEGTLLRLFNFNNKWYLSTHRKLDAFKSKWASQTSFGESFVSYLDHYYNNNETFKSKLGEVGENTSVYQLFLNTLDTTKQYMFLVPNMGTNRIVCKNENVDVYHVGTFVSGTTQFSLQEDIGMKYPEQHSFNNSSELLDYVYNVDYNQHQGLLLFGPNNKQYKILNDKYSSLYQVRGNEPSIKFRYLQVRMNHSELDKLYYLYPNFANSFDDYENTLYDIARYVNKNYVNRYIKHQHVVIPKNFYIFMQKCHKWHLENKEKNRISLTRVINLLNQERPSSLNRMIKIYNSNSFKENYLSNNTNKPKFLKKENNNKKFEQVDKEQVVDDSEYTVVER